MLFGSDSNTNMKTTITIQEFIMVQCLQHLLHFLKINLTLEIPLKPPLDFHTRSPSKLVHPEIFPLAYIKNYYNNTTRLLRL